MDNEKFILERCSVCDHFNYGTQTREYMRDPSTGDPLCVLCWEEIATAIIEFGLDLTEEDDPVEIATYLATLPPEPAVASNLEVLDTIETDSKDTEVTPTVPEVRVP